MYFTDTPLESSAHIPHHVKSSMANLVAYGSLIHPNELDKMLSESVGLYPVKVIGYKRTFNLFSIRRSGSGDQRAVLNATLDKNSWLNGVLLTNISSELWETLDNREAAYNRVKLSHSQITCPYECDKDSAHEWLQANGPTYIYIGKTERLDDNILPIDYYLQLCIEGACHWGEDFHRDFMQSAYVNHNVLLCDYCNAQYGG